MVDTITIPLTKTVRCSSYATCDIKDCAHIGDHEHSGACAGGCFGPAHCEPIESCDFCEKLFPESELVYHDDRQACAECVKVNGQEFYKRT